MRKVLFAAAMLWLLSSAPAWAGELHLDLQFGLRPPGGFSLDAGSLNYAGEHWTLAIGRQLIHYGPGQFGQLALGPAAGLDSLSFSASYFGLTYHQFWANLDWSGDRKLFGHRLEYSGEKLTVGLSETALMIGDIPPVFFCPLPWPYLLSQWFLLVDGEMENDIFNGVLGADMSWHPSEDTEIYAEVMIDDYPTFVPATAPSRAGALAGFTYRNYPNQGELCVEYTRINNFTYSHFAPETDYVHNGLPLGHWLGPDADMLAAEYSWDARDNTRLAVRGYLQRHGEGTIGDRWTAEDGVAPIIFTGDCEWWAGARVGVTSRLTEHLSLSGYAEGAVVYVAHKEPGNWEFGFEPGGEIALQWSF